MIQPTVSEKNVFARPVIVASVMLIVPVLPSTASSAPCQASRPARVTTNGGIEKSTDRLPWRMPISVPARIAGGDRQIRIPAVLDVQHGHHRRATDR